MAGAECPAYSLRWIILLQGCRDGFSAPGAAQGLWRPWPLQRVTVPKVRKGLLKPGAEGVGRAVKGQTDGAGGREKKKDAEDFSSSSAAAT